jgi:hypothetical protein
MQLFRPDRDGRLSLVDFVKSIDAVYKRYRLLLASIANTTTIDRAFERIFNFVYYVVVLIIVTSVWGFDPLALFLSLSSVLVGLAFMIGRTASTYFEGVSDSAETLKSIRKVVRNLTYRIVSSFIGHVYFDPSSIWNRRSDSRKQH